MKHRAPRMQWGLLATSLLVLVCVAAFIAIRSMDDSRPHDFGSPAVTPSAAGQSSRSPQPVPDQARLRTPNPDAPEYSGSTPRPQRLVIPRLEVSAAIDPVGVADDGEAEVPDDARRVGWYRFGPVPGSSEGSAVIVGHVDSRTQGLGVLAELDDVRENDRVEIRASNATTVYRIVSRRTVDKGALADSGAFRRTGPPVLTLITCTGPYLEERGGYQENLVVTAVPDTNE